MLRVTLASNLKDSNHLTFDINDITAYNAYFGLQLASPYYESKIQPAWGSKPVEVENTAAQDFINRGYNIYFENLNRVTDIVKKSDEFKNLARLDASVANNPQHLAVEQLKMFLPMCAPVDMRYTISLDTLKTLWRTAWNPEMRKVVNSLGECVSKYYPDKAHLFKDYSQAASNANNWAPSDANIGEIGVLLKPKAHATGSRYIESEFVMPKDSEPLEILDCSPAYMSNTQLHITYNVEVSAAGMGIEQKNSKIRCSAPEFTGKFYLPPLLQAAGLEQTANEYINSFYNLRKDMPYMELAQIAPHGAMVRYRKVADVNALIQDQVKSMCPISTREEIYHLGEQFRKDLINIFDKEPKLMDAFKPHCHKIGKCDKCQSACNSAVELCKKNFKERTL